MIIRSTYGQLVVRESLFWDVSKENLDPERNRLLIIERVITRGNLEEFSGLMRFYGKRKIKNTLKNIALLDKKSRNFAVTFFGLDKKELTCYQRLAGNDKDAITQAIAGKEKNRI